MRPLRTPRLSNAAEQVGNSRTPGGTAAVRPDLGTGAKSEVSLDPTSRRQAFRGQVVGALPPCVNKHRHVTPPVIRPNCLACSRICLEDGVSIDAERDPAYLLLLRALSIA